MQTGNRPDDLPAHLCAETPGNPVPLLGQLGAEQVAGNGGFGQESGQDPVVGVVDDSQEPADAGRVPAVVEYAQGVDGRLGLFLPGAQPCERDPLRAGAGEGNLLDVCPAKRPLHDVRLAVLGTAPVAYRVGKVHQQRPSRVLVLGSLEPELQWLRLTTPWARVSPGRS